MATHVLRLVLFALIVAGLSACRSDEEALAAHLEQAEQYFEAEQWKEAIIEYKNALQIDPNSAEAHFQLSQAYLKNEQPREGFWELRETVRLDPQNHDAVLQFAQISIYAGELEEAIKRADQVIAEDPDRHEAYIIKGQAYEGQRLTEDARAAYLAAVERAPEDRGALMLLANFYRRVGERDLAEPIYVRATEAGPSAGTYLALGGFLAEDRTRFEETEVVYRKALELAGPEDASRTHSTVGGFFYTRDRFDDAVVVIEAGIEKAENPIDLIYLLARLYRAEGNEEKADELAERATAARPDDPQPLLVLSSYRGRKGDLDGALEAAERAIAVDPESKDALLRKAEVLLELGFRDEDEARIAEGRTVVDRVIAEEPSNPGALFVKAKVDLAEQKTEDAIKSLRTAIDLKPDWAEAHFLLGTALALVGERTAARTELARALEIDASLAEARRVLADVHAGLGEHEYAVEEGRRYLATHPDSPRTRLRVAQSLVRLGRADAALAEIESIPEEARDAQSHYAIGRIYMARGRNEAARVEFEAALDELPTNADILGSLLELDRRGGDQFEASVERVNAALAANPDDARLRMLSGRIALHQNRVADAEAEFKKAVELDPDDMGTYRQLAEFYGRTGRTEQTIDTYQAALVVKPDQPRLHHFLAVLYEYGGQRAKAIEHYEAAIRYQPDLAESKNNLAYIFAEDKENLDRALDLAQEAKALMPDDPNAADTLGWVLYQRGVAGAAIGYLKEAEAGILRSMERGESGASQNLGLVRHHLALAYKASGDAENARETAGRAIAAHEAFVEDQRANGRPFDPEPEWYASAQEMRAQL